MGLLEMLCSRSLPLLCAGAGVVIVGIFVVARIVAFFRLRHIKGPLLASCSDWPHSFAMMGDSCHDWYTEISEKYGHIARIAPNAVITSAPEVWLHANNKPGWQRSDWYYGACRFEHQRNNIFSETNEQVHDRKRKQMAPGYSGRDNYELEESINVRVQELLNLIRSKYISSDDKIVPVDLGKKIQFFTMDVISTVGFGKSFGMLPSDDDVDNYLESTEEGLLMARVSLGLGLAWLAHAPIIGRFIAPSTTDNNGFGRMMAKCYQLVDERAANPTDKRSDMLASFMRHGLHGAELRTEALEQVLAGSDTTAGAIRSILLLIMTNARVYTKLQTEIDKAVQDGLAPAAGEGIIAIAQTKQLPYLQAVIREALRIQPPIANVFARDVPPGGDTLTVNGESIFLPGGTSVGYSSFSMQRNEYIYGSDAKAFRPERWFEPDAAKLAAMTRTSDLMFGHGKWQCLGKHVAQIEIGKSVFELLRNFDMAMINPTRPWTVSNCLGLLHINDMWVQVMDRKP